MAQRDFENDKTDLHQIFRDGRYVGVDVQSGIGFSIGQATLAWRSILGAKSAEIGDAPSFLGLALHNERQHGKAGGQVNSAEVLSTSCKNLVNFGPLTPESTMMVWRPLMRQMRDIVEMCSIILELAFDNGWQEPLNGFAPNSHGRRVWSFPRMNLNVKDKVQRSRSPGTKNALCTHNAPTVWTKWNAFVADDFHASSRHDSSIAAEGYLYRDVCTGPGGLPLGSAMHF